MAVTFAMNACLPVRPSVRPHETTQLPPDEFSWHILVQISFFFRKPFEKIKFPLKSDKNDEHFA
jgi:hypothetical protein